jgi:hypothetical protein
MTRTDLLMISIFITYLRPQIHYIIRDLLVPHDTKKGGVSVGDTSSRRIALRLPHP